jgi:hypothetical protein
MQIKKLFVERRPALWIKLSRLIPCAIVAVQIMFAFQRLVAEVHPIRIQRRIELYD